MSGHGSPAQVAPGFIVRIRASSYVYTSRRLTREEATTAARDVRRELRVAKAAGGQALLVDLSGFPFADLEELSLFADKVLAVEVRCVNGDGQLAHERARADAEDGAS